MRHVVLLLILGLLGLSACAEMSSVPEREMRGTTDGGPYGTRGYY